MQDYHTQPHFRRLCTVEIFQRFSQGSALNILMASISMEKGFLQQIKMSPQTIKKASLKRKRYRRCRSAPVAALNHSHPTGPDSLKRFQYISRKLHPNLAKVIAVFSIHLGAGTLVFYLNRDQMKGKKTNEVVDAVYFCLVTMTTVGYGDLVPDSAPTKLLACSFVFTGMALMALGLCKAADYLAEKQEVLLVRALHMTQDVGTVEMLKVLETKRVKYKCVAMSVVLVVVTMAGTLYLAAVEGMSFVDAFYCVCCSITTLGYGDMSFTTEGGRIFAIFWILTGTISLAQLLFYIAELHTERKQKKLVKWVLGRRITKLDLEAADLDEDGVVNVSDFIIYKLKEMGKISQKNIFIVIKEFEELDVDQSGTLSNVDVQLAQLSLRREKPRDGPGRG